MDVRAAMRRVVGIAEGGKKRGGDQDTSYY